MLQRSLDDRVSQGANELRRENIGTHVTDAGGYDRVNRFRKMGIESQSAA